MLDAAAGDPDENTYFASIIAASNGATDVVIGLSHNRWDGGRSTIYRPTFQTIPLTVWTDAAPRSPRDAGTTTERAMTLGLSVTPR